MTKPHCGLSESLSYAERTVLYSRCETAFSNAESGSTTMSSPVRTVPKTREELQTFMNKLFENKSHVKGVAVNPTTAHVDVTLDWAAHVAGYPDGYLPVKRAKVNEAKTLVERILTAWRSNFTTSDADISALFDMIDPMGT